MKKINIVFLILAIVWMVVIFCFSSRDGDTSAADSYLVGLRVGHVLVPGFDGWSDTQQMAFAEKIDHPVRKCAHATEYAILGMLLFGAVPEFGRRTFFWKMRLAWGIGTLYAATDEFHQLFVPGRSGQISDVILDSVGCGAGVIVVGVIIKVIIYIRYIVRYRD